nr:MAG TPA: hypothetical protein [Caudoviricetes sp.]
MELYFQLHSDGLLMGNTMVFHQPLYIQEAFLLKKQCIIKNGYIYNFGIKMMIYQQYQC